MAWNKNQAGVVIVIALLGALIGTVLGKLLVYIIPGLKDVLALGVNLSANLEIISFGIRFNIASVIGVIISLFIFRKI